MPSFLDFDLSARVGEKRILHWAKHDILFQIKVQAEPSSWRLLERSQDALKQTIVEVLQQEHLGNKVDSVPLTVPRGELLVEVEWAPCTIRDKLEFRQNGRALEMRDCKVGFVIRRSADTTSGQSHRHSRASAAPAPPPRRGPSAPSVGRVRSVADELKDVAESEAQLPDHDVPPQAAASGSGGSSGKSASRKRVRRRTTLWTPEEVAHLREGVAKFGVGKWSKILRHYEFTAGRSAVDIKDKWRNLARQKL